MRILVTYMWKEWRDQRAQVVGFASLVPLLLAIAFLAIPGQWARADALPTFVAMGGLLIGALTLASDLVPGESRRGRVDFLARLPGDLQAAFVAKCLFCAAGVALFCLYAWFWSTMLSALFAGGKWFAPFEWKFQQPMHTAHMQTWLRWSALDLWIVLVAWVFAVSCWLPRGTLALPAALLVLSVIGGPTVLVFLRHRGMAFHGSELAALRVWLPATALLAAALSFLRGLRHGRRPARIAGWALGGTLFAAAPVWGWTANRFHEYVALDLSRDELALEPVALGEGGRFVFANVTPRIARFGRVEDQAVHAVVIDLEDGSARTAGGPETRFELPFRTQSVGTTPIALLFDATEETASFYARNDPTRIEWLDGFDGRTGLRMDGERWKAFVRESPSIQSAIARERDFVVLKDGSRCWMEGITLHVEAREGTVTTQRFEKAPTTSVSYWRPKGAGFELVLAAGYVDLTTRSFVKGDVVRDRLTQAIDSSPTGFSGSVVAIRAEEWLLHLQQTARDRRGAYALWRPGSSGVRVVAGLGDSSFVVAALADERLLVADVSVDERGRPRTTLFRLDPTNGVRSPVVLAAGSDAAARISGIASAGTLPSGAIVCVTHDVDASAERSTRIARLPVDGPLQITAPLPTDGGFAVAGGADLPVNFSFSVIGCPDESTVVVLTDAHKILRAKFDGSPPELVFPRAATASDAHGNAEHARRNGAKTGAPK